MKDDTVPGQLEAIHQRLERGDKRMASIEAEVSKNTAITAEIKEILDAARLGFKVLGGLGVALKWAAGIAAALGTLWAIFHNGGPKP